MEDINLHEESGSERSVLATDVNCNRVEAINEKQDVRNSTDLSPKFSVELEKIVPGEGSVFNALSENKDVVHAVFGTSVPQEFLPSRNHNNVNHHPLNADMWPDLGSRRKKSPKGINQYHCVSFANKVKMRDQKDGNAASDLYQFEELSSNVNLNHEQRQGLKASEQSGLDSFKISLAVKEVQLCDIPMSVQRFYHSEMGEVNKKTVMDENIRSTVHKMERNQNFLGKETNRDEREEGEKIVDCKEKMREVTNSNTNASSVSRLNISQPNAFSFQEKDFPDLSLALKSNEKSIRLGAYYQEYKQDEPFSSEENCMNSSKFITFLQSKKFLKKQPKRKDPVWINIIDMLQHSSSKNHVPQKKKIRRVEVKRSINVFHSLNPILKRGKCREVPVRKKLSKLKLVILQERKKKRALSDPAMNERYQTNTPVALTENHANDCVESPIDHKSAPDQLHMSSDDADLVKLCSLNREDTINQKYSGKNKRMLRETLHTQTRLDKNGLKECHESLDLQWMSNNAESKDSSFVCDSSSKEMVSPAMHSRKFRDYCHNMRRPELDNAVKLLLKDLYRFQDRVYKMDPIRAHSKRRFVLGFREVKKYLKLRKLKVIIIAPDLEAVQSPGGLDELIAEIKGEGRAQSAPVIFAVSRHALGYVTMKKVPISIVGIFSYDGAEEHAKTMLDEWKIACDHYQKQLENRDDAAKERVRSVLASLLDTDAQPSAESDVEDVIDTFSELSM